MFSPIKEKHKYCSNEHLVAGMEAFRFVSFHAGLADEYTSSWMVIDVREPVPANREERQMLKVHLFNEQKRRCAGCDRRRIPEEFMELDHIVPIQRGGPDRIYNVCVLCVTCNRSKGQRTFVEWRRSILANLAVQFLP
jgi:hypothetical protein